jgi:nickel-dependent lactate racemase
MRADQICVLVATGLHRPNEGSELAELVGDPWVLQTVRVENHFARNAEDHVLVGTTRAGTVVKLDRRFVDADLKIVTGLVEPHFMAGYSGGRKVIAPGVAHAETITTFHNARFMSDPGNRLLDGNRSPRAARDRHLGRVGSQHGNRRAPKRVVRERRDDRSPAAAGRRKRSYGYLNCGASAAGYR